MTVYIPSYFKEYEERKLRFKDVIQGYLNHGFNIVVYWMNKEEDKILDERITYIDAPQVNASVARNHLLRIFYASEDDEAYFSDDDTIINDEFGLVLTEFDLVSMVNDKRHKLVETHNISSALFLLKNLKKKHGKELFFDETLDSSQDYDFGVNLRLNGLRVFTNNTIGVDINKGKSVMFDNQMQRLYKKNQTLHTIIKKWNLKEHGFSNR